MSDLRIRPAAPADADAWIRLRTALWPESPEDHPPEVASFFAEPPGDATCYIAEVANGRVVGFAEVGMRRYAEGCRSSPVGYLEGIYLEDAHRRQGHAKGLLLAGEAWARSRGCTEFASDRDVDNEESGAFHLASGFSEVQRIVCYRKDL
ncbi:MAG: GNAT family N-acetyltransferase [Gemmatimonadetes bacterium]|nr:GNAT family N-acetyltransferase [Gemmatimonadota bacterium]